MTFYYNKHEEKVYLGCLVFNNFVKNNDAYSSFLNTFIKSRNVYVSKKSIKQNEDKTETLFVLLSIRNISETTFRNQFHKNLKETLEDYLKDVKIICNNLIEHFSYKNSYGKILFKLKNNDKYYYPCEKIENTPIYLFKKKIDS